MSRRLHDLTIHDLDELPEACQTCVFWEVGDARQGPAVHGPSGRAAKEAWWQATQLEWGPPGKGVYAGDRLVAYAAYAPGEHYPRGRRLGSTVSEDAVLLATLWVAPDMRRSGLARRLLQALLRETHRRGARALEAYGWRHVSAAMTCALPEGFLLANGFAVLHEHELHPLLRLELRQTARESVHSALEGVLGALAQRERARSPAPAPRTVALPDLRPR